MGYVHIKDEYEPYLDLIIDCIKLKGENIQELIEKINKDDSIMANCMEDNLIQFKYHGKRIRDEYIKAVNEQIEKNEMLYDNCNELLQESEPTIEHIKSKIESLSYLIDGVNKKLNNEFGVSLNKIERLLKIIQEINNMSNEDKELLKKVLEIK